jgi:sulfite reductase beta subunit-like hemoprotein
VAFSSSASDTAYTYFHDLGFIPVIENEVKGFIMLLGGGIGAQPRSADVLFDFIPAEQIIPMSEAIIRVFDRYGERVKRNKARLKFLIKEVGLEQFMHWVNLELNMNLISPISHNRTYLPYRIRRIYFTKNGIKLMCSSRSNLAYLPSAFP